MLEKNLNHDDSFFETETAKKEESEEEHLRGVRDLVFCLLGGSGDISGAVLRLRCRRK